VVGAQLDLSALQLAEHLREEGHKGGESNTGRGLHALDGKQQLKGVRKIILNFKI